MSELLEILVAEEEEICRAFSEQLQRADCPTLVQTRAGDCGVMFEALCGCCHEQDDAPAIAWADSLLQTDDLPIPYEEVLTGVNCLERVIQLEVVKAVSHKKELIGALGELSSAVDRMRRSSVEAASSPEEEEPLSDLDFQATAESARDFIALATVLGQPIYINRAGRRLVGLEADEPITSANLQDFYSGDSWDELCNVAVPAVNEVGHWEGRSWLANRRTGDLTDVLTTMFLVRRSDDEKASCLAIWHPNPAQWKHTEQALVEAEARKNAILESSLDPIITIDHQGLISEFNRAAEQAFGHPRDTILGTRPSDVLFPESLGADHQNRIDRYLNAGEGSLLGRRIEVTAVRANGESFPAEMAMTIGRENGAPVLTYFVRDISRQKKAEREQVRYAAELERSNHELEQFAYVASHDLQEPLRKIRTFSDRLDMKCGEMLDETGRQCIGRMQNAAGRAQDLIEGLLTLSRITTRGGHFAKVDLQEIARGVVSDLEIPIEQSEGRVEIGRLPAIQADPLQMRQLLQNLIGNAIKFHRDDRPPVVKVHARFVKGGQRRADVSLAQERCRIVVEDNGIGFDEKYIERVFGIFQRLHPRDVYEGTGIGLAICRKIVERHGGTITAHGVPDQGATFEVVIPVVQPSQEEGQR